MKKKRIELSDDTVLGWGGDTAKARVGARNLKTCQVSIPPFSNPGVAYRPKKGART